MTTKTPTTTDNEQILIGKAYMKLRGSGELKSKQGLRKFDLFNLPECHREECFNIE